MTISLIKAMTDKQLFRYNDDDDDEDPLADLDSEDED